MRLPTYEEAESLTSKYWNKSKLFGLTSRDQKVFFISSAPQTADELNAQYTDPAERSRINLETGWDTFPSGSYTGGVMISTNNDTAYPVDFNYTNYSPGWYPNDNNANYPAPWLDNGTTAYCVGD